MTTMSSPKTNPNYSTVLEDWAKMGSLLRDLASQRSAGDGLPQEEQWMLDVMLDVVHAEYVELEDTLHSMRRLIHA